MERELATAPSTRFHAGAIRLSQVSEAILLQENLRQTFVEGGSHDRFLSGKSFL